MVERALHALQRAVQVGDERASGSFSVESRARGGNVGVIFRLVVLFLLNRSIFGLDYVVN